MNDTPKAPPVAASLDWRLVFKGSVNRWECDENDHLNVRFYSRMANEALTTALAEVLPAAVFSRRGRLVLQHMRYLAEARLATPISGFVALAGIEGERLRHVIELRHSFSETVLATFLADTEVEAHGLANTSDLVLPPHIGPRGLPLADSPFGRLRRTEAKALGFTLIGKGVIDRAECDERGQLPPHALMGRMSDAMPNLWAVLQTADEQAARANGFQGGAVLEYRMCHHQVLAVGGRYEIWSGVRNVSVKLQQFVHLLFDADDDTCVMSGEAVAVVLDLQARKAVEISPERRTRMQAYRVTEPAVR